MSVAYHSPHIEALAERVRRGQPAFTYTPTLSDDDGVRVMAGVYEIAPSRRRRGASRLSLKLAGLWLFPGWQIASVTEITMTRSHVIRRDRARLEQVA